MSDGLGAARVGAAQPDQHERRQRHHLERDDEGEQVAGGGQHQHPGHRGEQQEAGLARREPVVVERPAGPAAGRRRARRARGSGGTPRRRRRRRSRSGRPRARRRCGQPAGGEAEGLPGAGRRQPAGPAQRGRACRASETATAVVRRPRRGTGRPRARPAPCRASTTGGAIGQPVDAAGRGSSQQPVDGGVADPEDQPRPDADRDRQHGQRNPRDEVGRDRVAQRRARASGRATTPKSTRRSIATKYSAVSTVPSAGDAPSARGTAARASAAPGWYAPSMASISPQNPARPGSPRLATAANSTQPAEHAAACASRPPPSSRMSLVWNRSLIAADEEEQQAGDDAVGDVGEQRAVGCRPG